MFFVVLLAEVPGQIDISSKIYEDILLRYQIKDVCLKARRNLKYIILSVRKVCMRNAFISNPHIKKITILFAFHSYF